MTQDEIPKRMPGKERLSARYQSNNKAVYGLSVSKESKQKVREFLDKFPVKKHHIDQAKPSIVSGSEFKVIRSIVDSGRRVPPPIVLGPEMERKKTSLPVFECKKQIEKSIRNNKVTFITGGTGCGKTTQIPQYFLEEASKSKRPLRIVCTQPRRLPAIAIAQRVAYERGEEVGGTVGYHIRLDRKSSDKTVLTYCTTGILLRMLGVPSVDEIHEREIDTDCVLIILKEILKNHGELRVVLMSATMEGSLKKLEEFFEDYTIGHIKIESRLYDVKEFYLPEILALIATEQDVMTSSKESHASNKCGSSTRRQLFSMSLEAQEVVKNLQTVIPDRPLSFDCRMANKVKSLKNLNRVEIIKAYKNSTGRLGTTLIIRLVQYLLDSSTRGAILVFLPGINEIMSLKDQIAQLKNVATLPKVYILHSETDGADQEQVFMKAEGCRKVILSTNIAEASLTIDDVVFVIDSGVAKQKIYDHFSRTSELKLKWIAKSNAAQRKGRAGRCQNGYCFRLYTEQDYEAMREIQMPEMGRAALHEVVLYAKLFAPNGTSVKQFFAMALEPPSPDAIDHSIEYLKEIGAIHQGSCDNELSLTKLGHFIAHMPLDVKLSRMLIFGVMLKCLAPIVDLVAALAYKDPYVISLEEERSLANVARDEFGHRDFSDHLMLIRALEAYSKQRTSSSGCHLESRSRFCREKYLNPSVMRMMLGIRLQLVLQLKHMQFLPSNVTDHNAEQYNEFSESWPMVQAAIVAGSAIARRVPVKNLRFQMSEKTTASLHPGCVVQRHMKDSKHYRESIAQYAKGDERDPNIEFLAYQELEKLGEGIMMKTVTAVPPLTAFVFCGKSSIEEDLIEKMFAVKPVDADSIEPLAKEAQINVGVTDWLIFSGDFAVVQSLLKLRFKAALSLSKMLQNAKSVHYNEHEAFLDCVNDLLNRDHQGNYFDECVILEKRNE